MSTTEIGTQATAHTTPISTYQPFGSREEHLGALFEAFLTRGPLSRKDAARLTGLSAASVTKLVKPMVARGYLIEQPPEAGAPGRPQIPLAVDASRHHAIGVKLMEHEIVSVMADLDGQVRSSHRMAYHDTTPSGVAAAIDDITRLLLERFPVERDTLLGIGIGLGGHVDAFHGIAVNTPVFSWREVPIRQLVQDRTGLPVVIENDVNTLAVAEQWFGAGSSFPTFLLVTVGAGVGAALVLNGQLWHGVSGAAGEFGHMVIDPDGPPCFCGKRGCLETFVNDAALVGAMAQASGDRVTKVTQVIDRAHAGDQAARTVFAHAGKALGRAIATLLNLINPPLVILSGEGMAASDLLIDEVRDEMARNAFSTVADDCTVLTRPLPDETWARGAAATMLRRGVLHSIGELSSEVTG